MKRGLFLLFFLLIAGAIAIVGCSVQTSSAERAHDQLEPNSNQLEFTLQTNILNGRITYIGVGGDIDGVVNPDLVVKPGSVVRVILVNGDGMPHDLYFPDFGAKTALVSSKGATGEVSFAIGDDQIGTFVYFCTQPGHRQAGQEGRLMVAGPD